jgi:membrane protease YdiL (CAAX protease family)
MRVTTTVQVVVATLVMVVVVDHVYVISQQFMPSSDAYLESLKALKPTGFWSTALTFLGLCIVVPFTEEVVFRGLIQRVFALNMLPIVAVVLSGTFFGVIHLSPQLLVSMTCFGIFLAFVFYATSNLTYPIVGHAVLNAVAFVQLTFQSEDSFTDAPFYAQEWWYLPVAIGIVLILSREIKRGAARSAPAPLKTESLDDRE